MILRTLSKRQRGFTLLEIVVSLAILAVALPPLLQAFSRGTRDEANSSQRTTAFYLLRFQMESLLMAGYPEETGQQDGEFDEGSRYTWRSEVQETETEGLLLMTVSIIWDDGGTERVIATNTYIADPQLVSPEEEQQQQGGQPR